MHDLVSVEHLTIPYLFEKTTLYILLLFVYINDLYLYIYIYIYIYMIVEKH